MASRDTAGMLQSLLAGILRASGALLWAVLGLASSAAAAPLVVPDTLGQRLQACAACHGEQGRSRRDGYVPRIAGKPAGYLEQQLLNFRDGRRRHQGMAYLLENLSDAYLREIAGHFAAQRPPPPLRAGSDALPPLLAQRAEALVRQGEPTRRLPACVACHGEALGGIQPGVPGLLGLPADYLIAQLGAWRNGQRQARAPDCMAEIAKQVPEAELAAVARWLAAQPLPLDAQPQALPPARWPLDCGGITR